MKNILLAFGFIFLFSELKIASAQTYHPFPDTLAEWSEGSLYIGMCCSGAGYIYAEAGDTVIDNLVYTLLGYNPTYSWNTYWYQPPENFPYQIPGEIFGALREDSLHKVWFRNFDSLQNWVGCLNFSYPYFPFPVDSDMLLYDFGLSVGDTAYWTAYEFGKVVMRIDSFQLLDGTWRRVFDFDTLNDWSPFGVDYWIEGVGSHWGLFGPYCREPFEGECNLNCFNQMDIPMLESPYDFYILTDCNHIYTGIPEIESQKSISVFPNPANDFITFDLSDFPNEKFSLTIYNANGQQVNHYGNHYSSQLKIPVSQFGADNLYFYTITSEGQRIFTGKFLVLR